MKNKKSRRLPSKTGSDNSNRCGSGRVRAGSISVSETDPNGKSQHEPGAKLDAGKVRPGLIMLSMPRAMLAISQVATYGAKKYSEDGWLQVPDGEKRYTDAMLRHHLAEGYEFVDEPSGLLHAAQVAWNAMARLELMLRRKESE
jgi:hypothetical protein